jgi:hypothetical protein
LPFTLATSPVSEGNAVIFHDSPLDFGANIDSEL